MSVYYFILIWVVCCGIISNITSKNIQLENGLYEKRSNLWTAIVLFLPIIILVGLRSSVADTSVYISFFNDYPSNLSDARELILDEGTRDPGFIFLSVLLKQYVSQDYHIWLLFIATISGICVMYPIYKYSSNYGTSMFLFIVSCQFTWLLNGMRQFLVASVMFACTDLILKKKPIVYMIIVIIMSTIHQSALIFIPVYFIVQGDPWDKRTMTFIAIVVLALIFTEKFTGILDSFVENSDYASSMEEFKNTDDGTSVIRIAVESVPVIMAFMYRNKIKDKLTPIIRLSINMSLVASGLYIISKITRSGIMLGRLPIYFSMYNLILLPWLIQNIFEKNERRIVNYSMIICYLLFFYYQMVVTWNGLGYTSDILRLCY
ncbi:Transmembrane protein EpsG [Terrisporobacter petrolearius]|uniref:EpsG family protein n=1 Tax=Terrisporobacter petrolearius TaxID=1460447 RepID=UPI003367E4AB